MFCAVTDGRDECDCCTLRCWSITVLTLGLIGAIFLSLKSAYLVFTLALAAADQGDGANYTLFRFVVAGLAAGMLVLVIHVLAVIGACNRRRNFMIPFIVVATIELVLYIIVGVFFKYYGSTRATNETSQKNQEAGEEDTPIGLLLPVLIIVRALVLFIVWRYYIFLGLRQRNSAMNQSAQPQHIQMSQQTVINQPSTGTVVNQSEAPPPYAEKLSV